MVWYDLFVFHAFMDAEYADKVLDVPRVAFLLAQMVPFHAKRQTKVNLVQIEPVVEIEDVSLRKFGHSRVASLYQLNNFELGVDQHDDYKHECDDASS